MKVYLHFYDQKKCKLPETCIYNIAKEDMTLDDLVKEVVIGFKHLIDPENVKVAQTRQYGTQYIDNKSMLVKTFFKENDDIHLIYEQPSAPPKIVNTLQEEETKILFETIQKYQLIDQDNEWCKIQLDIPDIETIQKTQIQTRFFKRCFEVKIFNFKNRNFVFASPFTMYRLNPQKSQVQLKPNKLLIWIYKNKKENHWFSLYRQKSVTGVYEGDSDN